MAARDLLGRADHGHRHDRARHRVRPGVDDDDQRALDGDHYVVNGSKTFITNGINADLVITAVKTDPTQRHAGMSLLVLERGMAGFERGRNLEKIGMHAQDTAELFFTDVAVPVANRLGDEGSGFRSLVDQAAAGAAVDRRHRAWPPPGRRST